MANYLVIKNGNDIKSYEAKTTHTGVPYLRVDSGYLDLTTNKTSASTSYSTSYYVGSKIMTYQTAHITSTSINEFLTNKYVFMSANSVSNDYISSTYTSNNEVSETYNDNILNKGAYANYYTATMNYSKYTTESSELPYDRILISGRNICTKLTSSTYSSKIKSIDLKVKVSTTKDIISYIGTTSSGTYTKALQNVWYDSVNSIYVSYINTMMRYTTGSVIYSQSISSWYGIDTTTNQSTSHVTMPWTDITGTFYAIEATRTSNMGVDTVTMTYRPKETFTTIRNSTTELDTTVYMWNSYATTRTSSSFTTSTNDKISAIALRTVMSNKITNYVDISYSNGSTRTSSLTCNFRSIEYTNSPNYVNDVMNDVFNNIHSQYNSIITASKSTISALLTTSRQRTRSDANSSYTSNTSNRFTFYGNTNSIFSVGDIDTICPPQNAGGLDLYASASKRNRGTMQQSLLRTCMDSNSNIITETTPLFTITYDAVSNSMRETISDTHLITGSEILHTTFTSGATSRTYSITSNKGTASLWSVDEFWRRMTYSMTYVSAYTNSSSTLYDSKSYSNLLQTKTVLNTTVSTITEI